MKEILDNLLSHKILPDTHGREIVAPFLHQDLTCFEQSHFMVAKCLERLLCFKEFLPNKVTPVLN